jgi:HEAT repeat protein
MADVRKSYICIGLIAVAFVGVGAYLIGRQCNPYLHVPSNEAGPLAHLGGGPPVTEAEDAWAEEYAEKLVKMGISNARDDEVRRLAALEQRCIPVLKKLIEKEAAFILYVVADEICFPGLVNSGHLDTNVYALCTPWLREAYAQGMASPDPDTRAWGLEGMARIEYDRVPLLLKAAADPAPQVRATALAMMCVTPKRLRPQVVEALCEGLRDEHVEVKCVAIDRLAMLDAKEAVPALLRTLDDARRVSTCWFDLSLIEKPSTKVIYPDPPDGGRARSARYIPEVRQLGVAAISKMMGVQYWDTYYSDRDRIDEVVQKTRAAAAKWLQKRNVSDGDEE